MNKSMHVFLDIEGTYTALSSFEKTILVNLFEKIRKLKSLNTVFISFISTLDCTTIKNSFFIELKDLLEKCSDHLEIGPMIGCDGFFYHNKFFAAENFVSKAESMLLFIRKELDCLDLKEVIYADDCPNVNPLLLWKYLTTYHIDIPINIISKSKMCLDTHETFSVYINNNEKFLLYGMEALKNDSILIPNIQPQRRLYK